MYEPNLIKPALVKCTVSSFLIALRIFKMNVAILEEKNIFHVRLNEKNVLGRETSYIKRLPPIGAPKAAETPAAAPAHAISRLSIAFLNFLREFKGK